MARRVPSLLWQSSCALRAMCVTSHREYLYRVLDGLKEHYPHLYRVVMKMKNPSYVENPNSLLHYGLLLKRGMEDTGPCINQWITSIKFRKWMRYDEYFALYDMLYRDMCVIKNIQGLGSVHLVTYCMQVHSPKTVALRLCMNCWFAFQKKYKTYEHWVASGRTAYERRQSIVTYDLPIYLTDSSMWCSHCCTWLLFHVHQREFCKKSCNIEEGDVLRNECTMLNSTMVQYDMKRHFTPVTCKRRLVFESDSE